MSVFWHILTGFLVFVLLVRAIELVIIIRRRKKNVPTDQFLNDVRAVVVDHWSGLPENRPDEAVYSRLDAVLFDYDGYPRPEPDYEAVP